MSVVNIDGSEGFRGKTIRGDDLDKISLWHGSDFPSSSKIPTDGLFLIESGALYKNIGTLNNPLWGLVSGTPPGVIEKFAGLANKIPNGYLRCNGQAVSRTTYSRLFDVIGSKYGSGNGVTTFNLPDYETDNKFSRAAHSDSELGNTGGESEHVLNIDELPPHVHGYKQAINVSKQVTGVHTTPTQSSSTLHPSVGTKDANTASTGKGVAHENKPPFISVYFIIKT